MLAIHLLRGVPLPSEKWPPIADDLSLKEGCQSGEFLSQERMGGVEIGGGTEDGSGEQEEQQMEEEEEKEW